MSHGEWVLAPADPVLVGPLDGVIPRMGIRLNGEHRADENIFRKKDVEPVHERLRVRNSRQIGVKKLLPAMDARVRSPAAYDRRFLVQKFTQRVLDHLLHADRIGLVLPAMIASPVIADFEEVPHVLRA